MTKKEMMINEMSKDELVAENLEMFRRNDLLKKQINDLKTQVRKMQAEIDSKDLKLVEVARANKSYVKAYDNAHNIAVAYHDKYIAIRDFNELDTLRNEVAYQKAQNEKYYQVIYEFRKILSTIHFPLTLAKLNAFGIVDLLKKSMYIIRACRKVLINSKLDFDAFIDEDSK